MTGFKKFSTSKNEWGKIRLNTGIEIDGFDETIKEPKSLIEEVLEAVNKKDFSFSKLLNEKLAEGIEVTQQVVSEMKNILSEKAAIAAKIDKIAGKLSDREVLKFLVNEKVLSDDEADLFRKFFAEKTISKTIADSTALGEAAEMSSELNIASHQTLVEFASILNDLYKKGDTQGAITLINESGLLNTKESIGKKSLTLKKSEDSNLRPRIGGSTESSNPFTKKKENDEKGGFKFGSSSSFGGGSRFSDVKDRFSFAKDREEKFSSGLKFGSKSSGFGGSTSGLKFGSKESSSSLSGFGSSKLSSFGSEKFTLY